MYLGLLGEGAGGEAGVITVVLRRGMQEESESEEKGVMMKAKINIVGFKDGENGHKPETQVTTRS